MGFASIAYLRFGWRTLQVGPWLVVLALALQSACSDSAPAEQVTVGDSPDTAPQTGSVADSRDQEISRLVAGAAELRSRIRASQAAHSELVETIEKHQLEGQAELDALMREVASANDPGDGVAARPLDELAYETDAAFKERAQRILESALDRDLALQRRLTITEEELDELRSDLAEKERALVELSKPDPQAVP
jgi:hypothetical protein